ncbi:PIG-L deacetylase family protein [Thermoflavimicrobium daqui]|uniref:PIG-L family deacetylase n=1 Tax=Thermoflavimicrobium daqui TaxID=2137476 RepID=A0A364K3A9_9BACL|nr:PIG-L family deacetylase [Thermoflavimicrobium daqui]RAL23206.1 hypothetical protein DL897_12635 [Thermoflavimicrobium daqui]
MISRKRMFIAIIFSCTLLLSLFFIFKGKFQVVSEAISNENVSEAILNENKVESSPKDHDVIYFSPHADDEMLTYSVSILNDIRDGKKVHLVLISDGDRSFAREMINGKYDYESLHFERAGKKVFCKIHHTYHDPEKEKYKDGWLSRFEVGQARIREFYKAAEFMGVPQERVEVFTLKNDKYTVNEVRSIIRLYVERYPHAEFKTMSKFDKHPDHAKLGKVLEEFYLAKKIKKPTFFLSNYMARFSKKHLVGHRVYLKDSADRNKVKQGLNVYRTWKPQEGWYGLGIHSVPSQFESMYKNPYTMIDISDANK